LKGDGGDHILIGPPLNIEVEEIDLLIKLMDVTLTKVEKQISG